MAGFPSYDTIKTYYTSGKWNDRMLKTALTCKAITQRQYEEILASKKKWDQRPGRAIQNERTLE